MRTSWFTSYILCVSTFRLEKRKKIVDFIRFHQTESQHYMAPLILDENRSFLASWDKFSHQESACFLSLSKFYKIALLEDENVFLLLFSEEPAIQWCNIKI